MKIGYLKSTVDFKLLEEKAKEYKWLINQINFWLFFCKNFFDFISTIMYNRFEGDFMKVLKILEKEKRNKKIKYSEIAKILGISRQDFNYHRNN